MIDRIRSKRSLAGQHIVELGSDVELAVARTFLAHGAACITCMNPAFEGRTSADSRIKPIEHFAEDYHLPEHSFDIVFGIALLEHVHELERFAQTCGILLKENGIGFLHGNPLWTGPKGHHIWAEKITGTGNSYYFNDASNQFEAWEHITYAYMETGQTSLRNKGIPETDIQTILHIALSHPRYFS